VLPLILSLPILVLGLFLLLRFLLFLNCPQLLTERVFFCIFIQQISDTPFAVIHTEHIIFIAVGILDAPGGISLVIGTNFLSCFVKLNGIKFYRLLLQLGILL